MKKIFSVMCILSLFTVFMLTGCENNDNNQTEVSTVPSTTLGYPGENGKVDPALLDESNLYEVYADSDREHVYPLQSYECEDDGTIICGDNYEYDENHNTIKQVHYEGDILDYTEVREYDEKNQNTKIISYAGDVRRENLVSTTTLEYDDNGDQVRSETYDSDNALVSYDVTTYVEIDGLSYIKDNTVYDSNDEMTSQTVYTYRNDGTPSYDIRTVYENGDVAYHYQTTYNSEGDAVAYDYFDKNNKKIDTPQQEIDAFGE